MDNKLFIIIVIIVILYIIPVRINYESYTDTKDSPKIDNNYEDMNISHDETYMSTIDKCKNMVIPNLENDDCYQDMYKLLKNMEVSHNEDHLVAIDKYRVKRDIMMSNSETSNRYKDI